MTRRAIGEGDAMTWREFLEERTALYDVEEGARDAAFWTRVETFGLDVELWRTEEGREFITLRGFLRAIHVRRERLPDLMRALREMVR